MRTERRQKQVYLEGGSFCKVQDPELGERDSNSGPENTIAEVISPASSSCQTETWQVLYFRNFQDRTENPLKGKAFSAWETMSPDTHPLREPIAVVSGRKTKPSLEIKLAYDGKKKLEVKPAALCWQ